MPIYPLDPPGLPYLLVGFFYLFGEGIFQTLSKKDLKQKQAYGKIGQAFGLEPAAEEPEEEKSE
jgi:hypothetical protein